MYITLAAIALGAAVIGLIYAAIFAQTNEKLRPAADSRLYWSLLIWTAVLGLVLFAATWPSHPPFAAGLTLGWGFLIGLLLSLCATVEARRSFADGQWLVRSAGLLAAAVAGPALILIIFGAASADALMGCALGGVLVAAIWRSALAPMGLRQAEAGDESLRYRSVELFALLNCALVAGTWLALEKYPATSGVLAGVYWALPVLLAAVVVVATVIAAGFVSSAEDASGYRRPLAIGLAVSLVLIVATMLINSKLLGGGLAGTVVVLGIFGFVLISWLAVTEKHRSAGLGSKLLESALADLDGARETSVTTFRHDQPEGLPARRLYLKNGFIDFDTDALFGGHPRCIMKCPPQTGP